MTKQQKKDVRRALRRYGRALEEPEGKADGLVQAWESVIAQAMDYYAAADPVCAELLQRRYIAGEKEWDVVGGAAHRADDLLPQRAGSAEHAGGVCRAGGAGVTLLVQRKQAGQRCPAFSACKKVHSFCFGARAVDWG